MLYFDYNPKQITEEELEQKIKELFANSTFQLGDIVELKGDINSPIMSITELKLSYITFICDKLKQIRLNAVCTYFNKSKQEFTKTELSVLCLTKVELQ